MSHKHPPRLLRRPRHLLLRDPPEGPGPRGPHGHRGHGRLPARRSWPASRPWPPSWAPLRHTTVDARQELFDDYLRYLIAGNVLRGGLYPLSVSAERVCQAKRVVAHAKAIGATALAHGSTGAGNDQVRFDVAFRTLAPDLELLAPIRELAPSRAEERAFLDRARLPLPREDRGLQHQRGHVGHLRGRQGDPRLLAAPARRGLSGGRREPGPGSQDPRGRLRARACPWPWTARPWTPWTSSRP